jgi:hypothetical protein
MSRENLDHGIRRQAIDQVRAVLALFPTLALRYPIKKWAAMAALAAATFYLVLSGAEVATQRSYIITQSDGTND